MGTSSWVLLRLSGEEMIDRITQHELKPSVLGFYDTVDNSHIIVEPWGGEVDEDDTQFLVVEYQDFNDIDANRQTEYYRICEVFSNQDIIDAASEIVQHYKL